MKDRKNAIIVPGPARIRLHPARLTDYGRELYGVKREDEGIPEAARWLLGLSAMAGLSDFAENKVLNHAMGKESWTMPATVALALCTAVPTDSSTGATITEASYTGYARKVIAASALSAASGGEIKNSEALVFAECTASTSTIIGYGVCDNSTKGAGNLIAWGTSTSTVISTTQTPPTIAANALVVTAD